MEIKLGDVVRLKSGSPEMTVTEIQNEVYITVIYWDVNKAQFQKQSFMADSLINLDQSE
jgi:uncharacterized protein YodC (DUF2158 family)